VFLLLVLVLLLLVVLLLLLLVLLFMIVLLQLLPEGARAITPLPINKAGNEGAGKNKSN
jgi:hypothetical protein